jgi:hypothetical protein
MYFITVALVEYVLSRQLKENNGSPDGMIFELFVRERKPH